MKRNLTKVFLSLFAICFILITATAATCVGAVKTNGVAACKFELDDVPTKIIVEMIASIEDIPDIIVNEDINVNEDVSVNDSIIENEHKEIVDDNISTNNTTSEDASSSSEVEKSESDNLEIETSPTQEDVEVINPTETKPAEEKPAESKPIEPNPAETKPAETKPLQLTGGYASVDRSAYTDAEIELLDIILERINANLYNLDIHEENIPLNAQFDYESYCKVSSYFYVYYGQKRAVDETFDLVNAMREDGYLRLRYDDIREFEAVRQQNQAKIDSILSGFTSGSEEHVLKQISEYLKNSIVYTNGYYDLSSALDGVSVCNGYALAFNAMANRTGIKSDMCIGKVGGSYHAWNRVTLSDGSYRFYDITFYDSNGKTKYLNATSSFHGSYLINDYTDCWFKR